MIKYNLNKSQLRMEDSRTRAMVFALERGFFEGFTY